MRLRLSWRTVAVIGAGVLVLPVIGSVSFASSTSRVSIAGSMPSWAQSAHATGNTSPSTTLDVNVILALRGGTAAETLAASLSNPKSASYGKYETAAQFNAKFAPTASTVSKVRSYLSGQGLKVTEVADGNRWVSVQGTATQLNKAFGVTLKNYSYQGKTQISPSAAATLPSDIASVVTGITGLDTVSLVRVPTHTSAAPLTAITSKTVKPAITAGGGATESAVPESAPPSKEQPCSVYWGQYRQSVPAAYGKTTLPTYNCGYFPDQIETAYGVEPLVKHGVTGKGVTVAIIDAYSNPEAKSDLNDWSSLVGVPSLKSGQYTDAGTSSTFNEQADCGGADGWYEEEALDLEAVHGMAPGANIHFVGAKNCDAGIDKSINWVIQHHAADLVSNSYGNTGEAGLGSEVSLEHSLFLQAAVEGIGFYFSSGDDGDETDSLPAPAADYPATDPMVTAVGGTSLGINKDGSKLFETSWGTATDNIDFPAKKAAHYDEPLPGSFWGGGGGGTSTLFPQPYYQKNTVPSSLAKAHGKTAMRVEPDVSMLADPFVGYFIVVTIEGVQEGGAIGGTSLASPLFAGFQALASQGRPVAIGFANPLMYNLGSLEFNDINNPATPRAVTDVDGTYVASFGFDTSLKTAKGYDDATGLGSPNGALFLAGEAL
jgi:subtilase family serine protease